jgi:hypothetical protein
MADKEFRIKIGTDGDPSGAKEVEKAIDDTTDAARELEAATGTSGTSNTGATDALTVKFKEAETGARRMEDATADLGDETRRTDVATDALERSVEQLNEELAKNKSLTTEQAANLRKVADGGERLVRVQRQQAAAADTGAKANRNLGMAALAGAQAFEDMQYGIRGVLNNIPQMVLMLGGTAGLTAVISIASVAGTILWEKMRKGPEEAADKTRDLLTELRAAEAVYADLERAANREREQRSETLSKLLADQLSALEFASRVVASSAGREGLRIDAEKRVAIARQQLELAALEAGITGQSGMDAVKMAQRRKEIAEEIVRIEKEALEKTRTAELDAARNKLQAAEERLNAIKESPAATAAEKERNELRLEVEALYDTVRQIQEARAAMIASLEQGRADAEAEIEDIRTTGRPGLSPAGEGVLIDGLEAVIERNTRRIAEILEKPDPAEYNAAAEAKAREEALADAEARLAELAAEERAAATAIRDAALALSDLRQRQEIQRNTDRKLDDIGQRKQAIDQLSGVDQKAGEEVGKLLDQILSLIGGAADQPAVTEKAGQLRDLISNGLQSGESDQARQLLLQLVGKIDSGNKERGVAYQKILTVLDAASSSHSTILGRLDELERQFRTNSRAGGQGNPNF